jgi:lipid-A-disaccharide synthase
LNNKIFISAGDLSGEIHAANLVREIKKANPSWRIYACGGENLKAAADEFIEDIVNINAFGFFPIKQVLFLKKFLKRLLKFFETQKPDKIILVDYYGFHIHVAKAAKKLGIPVYYYISPQVWASRPARIKKLAATVKKMLVILPFEEELYKKAGIDAVFVGNPLIDRVPYTDKSLPSTPPLIGLFPGSRKSVIKRHMPIIIKTAKILRDRLNADFVMFTANDNFHYELPQYIKIERNNDWEIRKSIDFAVCPSGTVSLENSLMGIPMAVMYKLSYFNYFIMRMIAKVKYITIANILADKSIVPEFIQFDAKPEKIADCVIAGLNKETYAAKVKELSDLRKMLGEKGVSKRAAAIISGQGDGGIDHFLNLI